MQPTACSFISCLAVMCPYTEIYQQLGKPSWNITVIEIIRYDRSFIARNRVFTGAYACIIIQPTRTNEHVVVVCTRVFACKRLRVRGVGECVPERVRLCTRARVCASVCVWRNVLTITCSF